MIVQRMSIPAPIEAEVFDNIRDAVGHDDEVYHLLARVGVASVLIVMEDGSAVEYRIDPDENDGPTTTQL